MLGKLKFLALLAVALQPFLAYAGSDRIAVLGADADLLLPVNTYPYMLHVSSRAGLDISVNGTRIFLRSKSSKTSDHRFSIPLLSNDSENKLRISSDQNVPFSARITRGDLEICSLSESKNECKFNASVAFSLTKSLAPPFDTIRCIDHEFIEDFLSPYTKYQKYHTQKFFKVSDRSISNCSPLIYDMEDWSEAVFKSAPSPRKALHTQFDQNRNIVLLSKIDLPRMLSNDDRMYGELQSSYLVIVLDSELRVLPLKNKEAYGLLSETQ